MKICHSILKISKLKRDGIKIHFKAVNFLNKIRIYLHIKFLSLETIFLSIILKKFSIVN